MNTLLLAPELFTTDSGIPRILRLYLKALGELATAQGGRVDFVALNDAAIEPVKLQPYGSSALAEGIACHRDKLQFVRATLRLSRRADFLLCGHVAQLPVAWLAGCLRPSLRYALVAHGIEVWRPFSFWERRALRGAWRIFCISEFTKRELLRHVALDESRLVVLPNALDPQLAADEAAPVNPSPTLPVILTVSRLSYSDRYKGIDHLIEAMPAIIRAEPAAKLRIVGRGDDLSRLQALSRSLAVDGAVEFAGFVSDADLRGEFARCRIFALPSEKEGFGLVYLEAMAHGKPCLGARAGGTPEVITAETGVLVEYGDVPGLATATLAALRQTWNREALLARAQHFSYSQFKARLASLLPA
jgi:glycosyltransferase involved in cell wall biosynthesis